MNVQTQEQKSVHRAKYQIHQYLEFLQPHRAAIDYQSETLKKQEAIEDSPFHMHARLHESPSHLPGYAMRRYRTLHLFRNTMPLYQYKDEVYHEQ